MAFFFCRLIGPRPTFAFDMTAEEAALMGRHTAYLHSLGDRAIICGPVGDPAGPWGLGVFEVADEAELKILLADDPTMKANVGFRYETMPILKALLGSRPGGATAS